jgi:hypothetical protein
MSILIGYNNLDISYFNTSCGADSTSVQTIAPTSETTYVSLVKRVGLDWKIEMHESGDKSKHLNYIESLRGNPNVEEAKVLQFNKIAEVVNSKLQYIAGSGSPSIIEIKLL